MKFINHSEDPEIDSAADSGPRCVIRSLQIKHDMPDVVNVIYQMNLDINKQ